MTRTPWIALSAAAAVGAVAGLAIGVAVGRATAPAAPPAASDAPVDPTAGGRGEGPALVGTARPPAPADVLTFDVGTDPGFAWSQFDVLLAAGRLDAAAVAARALCRDPAQVAHVEARLAKLPRPEDRLRVVEALRATGIAIPASADAYVVLLALAGRAADALRSGPETLSAAPAGVFQPLLREAMRRGLDDGALREQAVRDAWPAWKLRHVAETLAAANAPDAGPWATLAQAASAAEARRAQEREVSTNEDRLADARRAVAETPESAEAWADLGDVLRDVAADAAGAADAYERALDRDPFSTHAAEGLAGVAVERLLPRIRERWRELPDDERLTILATTLLRTGHGAEATAAFFRCRELDTAWLLAGLASLAPGPALASLDTRLALANDESLRLARVDALAALGRVAEAREALAPFAAPDRGSDADALERLLPLDPERVLAAREPERATLTPGDELRVFLADALRRVGRGAEAKDLVAPFVAAHPEWPSWNPVASLVAALDPEVWLPPVEARTRDPEENEDSTVWANLAAAYALLGRSRDAVRAYDEAIARDPEDMTLRIRRLRLR